MSLSKFDYTREGSAQARDYRNNPYPTDDYEYGEVGAAGHPPRRKKRKTYKYARDIIASFWNRDPQQPWDNHILGDSISNLAWSLNRNELAVLRYIAKYSEWNGVSFGNPLPYFTASKYHFAYKDRQNFRLIECGYMESTPSAKAGVYANRLYQLGLISKQAGWNPQYKINVYSQRVIDIRK